MKTIVLCLASLAPLAVAQSPVSALEACRALPRLQHKLIARVTATGGKPVPEVWTVLVHDGKSETGLREYTVTAGTVVATRGISEHVEKLTESDAIGLANIRLDSTEVAALIFSYADANALAPVLLDYDLRKEGADAAPLWRVTARDEHGAQLGRIIVAANTGAVVAREGFSLAPTPPDLKDTVATAAAKPTARKSTPAEKPGVHRRIGGKLQKFFTGKDTISK